MVGSQTHRRSNRNSYIVAGSRLALVVIAVAIVLIFPIRYGMPFRLDDVLLMEWAHQHSIWDAFDAIRGQIVNSVRPLFAVTAWILTHTAGAEHPVAWHAVLVVLLTIALVYLARTASYISRSAIALPLSPIVYFLGFTAILNVFFWFSDMTYGLELCFTTMAWYYGTRGLLEGRIGFWLTAMLTGMLAILSKEPAVVMVHVVLIATLLLEWREVRTAWKGSRVRTMVAIASYLALLAVTIWILAISPTRINRFFALSDPNLRFYIADRLSYYSSIYCSPVARALLFFPVVFVAVRRWIGDRLGERSVLLSAVAVVTLIVVETVVRSGAIAIPVMVLALTAMAVYNVPERRAARRLLPYLATIVIAFATLLVTIQLVKTQLTEIAFLTTLIAVWGWVATGRILLPVVRLKPALSLSLIGAVLIGAIVGVSSKIRRQEHVLREARDVRWNANDAVMWAAHHLPSGSSLAVTTYSLHGYDNSGALTGSDDETKLREQATFDAGFVYIFLEQLGRSDIDRAYLTDSTTVGRVLGAYRHVPNSYLFIQTELDKSRLLPLRQPSDSTVATFRRGGFTSEIWKLQSSHSR